MLLDTEEEIPCDLLAKLVKFQLLQIKSNDLQRRRAEQASSPSKKYLKIINYNLYFGNE